MKEVLKGRIQSKQELLMKWQSRFKTDVESINDMGYEQNAINELIAIHDLKVEINTLQDVLMLMQISDYAENDVC